MRTDAASLGFFDTPWGKFPCIQLLTVAELLDGAAIQYPHMTEGNKTFKAAPKAIKKEKVPTLFEADD